MHKFSKKFNFFFLQMGLSYVETTLLTSLRSQDTCKKIWDCLQFLGPSWWTGMFGLYSFERAKLLYFERLIPNIFFWMIEYRVYTSWTLLTLVLIVTLYEWYFSYFAWQNTVSLFYLVTVDFHTNKDVYCRP